MKIVKIIAKLSFKYKLILFFSMIILISILFEGVVSYYEAYSVLQEDIEVSNSKILREVNLNLERYFDQYEQIFYNIATSDYFGNWLLAEKGDKATTSQNYVSMMNYYIKPISQIYPEIISLNLLSKYGNNDTFFLKSNLIFNEGYYLENEPWIKDIKLNNKVFIVTGKNGNYNKGGIVQNDLYTLRIARKFSFSPNAEGYIELDVSMEPVTEILREMKYSNNGEGMIISGNGVIMADTDLSKISEKFEPDIFNKEIMGKESGYIFDKKNNRIIVFSTIKNIGWKSVSVIPYDAVAGGISRIWSISIVVIGISIVLSFLLVVLISSSLTRRIQKIRVAIKQTKEGDYNAKIKVQGSDEIAELSVAYNSMLSNLDQKIHELSEIKMMQQEAVLSALQSQINSHFLYNTLEIVNSMAYIAKQKDIQKVVIALSNMLRYTSNYKDSLVTINDEVEHLRDYLEIVKVQIGEKLSYSIEMEENVENVLCLKAIIQPIVENCIKHGLNSYEQTGYIKVQIGFLGDSHIYIIITDNGKGFEEVKLKEIMSKLEIIDNKKRISDFTRVGLVNVNYRLKVYYNYDIETGVQIVNFSKRNGTQVRIFFPLQRKGEV